MFNINTLRLAFFLFIMILPALAGAKEKEPSRSTIEDFVASKIWAVADSGRMEIRELDYEVYLDESGNSGRISVKGKLMLRDDLYERAGEAWEAAVNAQLADPELAAEGRERARKAYGNQLDIVKVVNTKGSWTPFNGNVFFQREVNGWSLSVPMFGESIRYAEPDGKRKAWFIERNRNPGAFIVVDSPEFETLVQLSVLMGQAYENDRLELFKRMEPFFENVAVIERFTKDDDAVQIFVFKNKEPFAPRKSLGRRGRWEFTIEGEAEFLQPLKRSFGRMETGDIVPARVVGSIWYSGQSAEAPTGWKATMSVLLPENWPRVRENVRLGITPGEAYEVPWDGEKFERSSGSRSRFWRVTSRQPEGGSTPSIGVTSGRESGNDGSRDGAGEEGAFSMEKEGSDVGVASNSDVVEIESVRLERAGAAAEEHVFSVADLEQADEPDKAGSVRESGTLADREIPAELLALAERGVLTVRALRGFGFLDAEEDRIVLSLRSRGIDLLGADIRQLRLWADVGGVDEKSFSENEMFQLRKVIFKLEMLEERVKSRG
jgi:hypothetical protein